MLLYKLRRHQKIRFHTPNWRSTKYYALVLLLYLLLDVEHEKEIIIGFYLSACTIAHVDRVARDLEIIESLKVRNELIYCIDVVALFCVWSISMWTVNSEQ